MCSKSHLEMKTGNSKLTKLQSIPQVRMKLNSHLNQTFGSSQMCNQNNQNSLIIFHKKIETSDTHSSTTVQYVFVISIKYYKVIVVKTICVNFARKTWQHRNKNKKRKLVACLVARQVTLMRIKNQYFLMLQKDNRSRDTVIHNLCHSTQTIYIW